MPKRVDDNQRLIVRAIEAYGAIWISTSGDPKIGFDGIVAFKGKYALCEIKNPKRPPNKRRLTQNEAALHAQLFRQQCVIWILQTPSDVTVLIEEMRQPLIR